jgi:hypothetical protein
MGGGKGRDGANGGGKIKEQIILVWEFPIRLISSTRVVEGVMSGVKIGDMEASGSVIDSLLWRAKYDSWK